MSQAQPRESDTAMNKAFEAAGYMPPKMPLEQAIEVAITAWTKWSVPEGGGARRDYVRQNLTVNMLWAMMNDYQRDLEAILIGLLLKKANDKIQAEKDLRQQDAPRKGAGADQSYDDTQSDFVRADLSNIPVEDDSNIDFVRSGNENTIQPTSTKKFPFSVLNLSELAGKHQAATTATIDIMKRLSRLDTIEIGDKKIGDCTVAEVRLWAAQRKMDQRAAARDVRFALSLVANLDGGKIIREWVKPEEADSYYDRAEVEQDAA